LLRKWQKTLGGYFFCRTLYRAHQRMLMYWCEQLQRGQRAVSLDLMLHQCWLRSRQCMVIYAYRMLMYAYGANQRMLMYWCKQLQRGQRAVSLDLMLPQCWLRSRQTSSSRVSLSLSAATRQRRCRACWTVRSRHAQSCPNISQSHAGCGCPRKKWWTASRTRRKFDPTSPLWRWRLVLLPPRRRLPCHLWRM